MSESQQVVENAEYFSVDSIFAFATTCRRDSRTGSAPTVLETSRRKVKRPYGLQKVR